MTMHAVEAVITPTIEGLNCRLVQAQLSGKVLQIMVERDDQTSVTIQDCARISREVSVVLDVEDTIKGAYRLEVSSPGIDKPLVKLTDFEKHVGYEVDLKTKELVEGRGRFKGRMTGVEGDLIQVCVDNETYDLPYEKIGQAKLVLTQKLLSKT